MEPPPTKADVATDDGCFFGLGEMSERDCWGRDVRGVFWSQRFFMANVDRN